MSFDEVDSLDAYMASLTLPSGDPPLSITQARTKRNTRCALVQTSCKAVVKNRRYHRLQQLMQDPSDENYYFSDSMMQQRSPALFHFYLGQYLGRMENDSSFKGSTGQTFSSFLMDTCRRNEMEARRIKEQETWTTFVAMDEKQEQRRLRKLYEEDNAEEQEIEEEEEDETTLYTVDERRQQLIDVMRIRFLTGMDSEYVNYAEIDADEALDDLDEMQRDAEDRYFAE